MQETISRWRQARQLDRLKRWSTLGILASGLAGCGATSRSGGDGGPVGGGGSDGQGAKGGSAGSLVTDPSSGAASEPIIKLDGNPEYFRFVRLTNSQWAASVREVLKLAKPSTLAADFEVPVMGITDFSNNEILLDVDSRNWADFQAAAETLAQQVTASAEALSAVYSGTDAAGFIKTVGRRAYRRPLTTAEVDTYTTLFESGAAMVGEPSEFAKGAAMVIRGLLQSPNFLYRTELGETGEALSGYEAAAKLSLWLRDASPNDDLLDAAETLTSPDAVADMATQMIGEATAMAVMRQFHGELLHFARLSQISKVGVPSYDPALNPEYLESSYLFFDRIFSKDLGVREMLTSTRGFMGPGMAPLYGIANNGSGFIERDLGPHRVGYFSQLPYLTVHAVNVLPHSIHRGLALALDVLCSPLGPPPNGVVPPLPDHQPGQTNRQYIDPQTAACGSVCHNQIINPLGFAFEHFDGMGQFRETEGSSVGELPIDSSGSFTFATGKADFADNVELMAAMAESQEAHLCYAKKLASFALQRDIVPADLPWLSPLASLSHDDAASTKQIMVALVKNDAFRTHAAGAQ